MKMSCVMYRAGIAAVVLALVVVLAGCFSQPNSAIVKAEGNKAEGYSWVCVIEPEGIVRNVSSIYSKPTILSSKDGYYSFVFEPVSEGMAEINFYYYRYGIVLGAIVYIAFVNSEKNLTIEKYYSVPFEPYMYPMIDENAPNIDDWSDEDLDTDKPAKINKEEFAKWGAIMLTLGILGFLIIPKLASMQLGLLQTGRKAEGTVIGIINDSGKKKRVAFGYTVGEKTYENETLRGEPLIKEGDKFIVVYDPRDPSKFFNMDALEKRWVVFCVWASLALLVAGIVFLIIG